MGEETDETLAQRAAQGCRKSLSALLERHYDRIHRLAWRFSGATQDADDIAQDVCVKIARTIAGYRAEAAFTTWLHRVAYTTAIDHVRSKQRMVATEPSEVTRLIDAKGGSAPAVSDGAASHAIWDSVRALPDKQRDAVLLVYAEEMSHAEAAKLMACSENTVSWHIHEAKKKLKISFERAG